MGQRNMPFYSMARSGGSYALPLSWPGLLIGLIVLVFIWVAFFDSHSLWRYWELKQQHRYLIRSNQELRAEIARLQQEIVLLRRDPRTIERIAREQYGMRRPGETVYRLVPRP